MEKAAVTVEDSCDGMVKLLDSVTKESHGGKFWEYTGELLQL
jgi:norsolorinic acid ketoreductase